MRDKLMQSTLDMMEHHSHIMTHYNQAEAFAVISGSSLMPSLVTSRTLNVGRFTINRVCSWK